MVTAKLYFWNLEPLYKLSAIGIFEIISVIALLIVGTFSIVRKKPGEIVQKNGKNAKIIPLFVLLVAFVGVFSTYVINVNKKTLHWDAIALYDARSKFLEKGYTFSEMPTLSEYDNLNKYYYLLYPPYTSIEHFLWRNVSFTSNIPVSVYYSFIFLILILSIYFITRRTLGTFSASIISLLVAWNGSMVNIAIKEYTNLPFTLHIVIGVFLIMYYIKQKHIGYLLLGILMIGTSSWIRMLEPVWLAVFLAFTVTLFNRKKKYWGLLPAILLAGFCFVQYSSWIYFTKSIAKNPGFLNVNSTTLIEPIFALFTGAPFVIIPTVLFKWGLPFFIHFITLVVIVLKYKSVKRDKSVVFLAAFVVISILMYLSQLYLLSFQFDWWSIIAMSLDRSSTFLIPVSIYLLIWSLQDLKGVFGSKSKKIFS